MSHLWVPMNEGTFGWGNKVEQIRFDSLQFKMVWSKIHKYNEISFMWIQYYFVFVDLFCSKYVSKDTRIPGVEFVRWHGQTVYVNVNNCVLIARIPKEWGKYCFLQAFVCSQRWRVPPLDTPINWSHVLSIPNMWGTPFSPWREVPWPGQGGVPPSGLDNPPGQDRMGYPLWTGLDGYLPSLDWMGYTPTRSVWGIPLPQRQNNRVSTCYFLVVECFSVTKELIGLLCSNLL